MRESSLARMYATGMRELGRRVPNGQGNGSSENRTGLSAEAGPTAVASPTTTLLVRGGAIVDPHGLVDSHEICDEQAKSHDGK